MAVCFAQLLWRKVCTSEVENCYFPMPAASVMSTECRHPGIARWFFSRTCWPIFSDFQMFPDRSLVFHIFWEEVGFTKAERSKKGCLRFTIQQAFVIPTFRFIPKCYMEKESDHLEDFAPELAMVTKFGNEDIDEPVAIRTHQRGDLIEAVVEIGVSHWSSITRWFQDTKSTRKAIYENAIYIYILYADMR